MRFSLVDKIVEIDPGRSIVTEKYLCGSEDYLADHFPNFACMPGVLMLESLYQAGTWL
ncbi:MAG: beta-hydroxyacyl-ACP dehydratase, partial [Planctomycetales bacterium]|nr:beta-hydroxyacyl-ACP dehydratase [Planctomycetales bacterium]